MFGFKRKTKEPVDLYASYIKSKNTPESPETTKKLNDVFALVDAFNHECTENAEKYRIEYEQGLIDWETYNWKRSSAMQDRLTVSESVDHDLRKKKRRIQKWIAKPKCVYKNTGFIRC